MTSPARKLGAGSAAALEWQAVVAGLFLFVLPFSHVTALRSIALSLVVVAAIDAWRRQHSALPLAAPLLAWMMLGTASIAWSGDPMFSQTEVRHELIYPVACFYAFYLLTSDEGRLRCFLRVLVASQLVAAALALAVFALHADRLESLAIGVGDRNSYSTFVVVLFPGLLFALASPRLAVAPRPVLITAVVAGLVSAAPTLNRIMWPALAASALVFVWRLRAASPQPTSRPRTSTALLFATLAILVLLGQFLLISEVKRASFGAGPDIGSYLVEDPRQRIWEYSVERLRERPIFGFGFGRGILQEDFREALGSPLYWHGHDVFLNQALGMGVIGLALFAWVQIAVVRGLFRPGERADGMVAAASALGLALFAAALMRGLVDDLVVRANALLYWAQLGMAFAVLRWPTGQR